MTIHKSYKADSMYFSNLKPPLSPNAHEINIYKEFVLVGKQNSHAAKSLLLGYTESLFDLCDKSMDINFPSHILQKYPKQCIQQDWLTQHDTFYETIIGDGILNLVGGHLVQHLSKSCNTLVIRFFTDKIDTMKYATYFRHNTDCLLPDKIIPTQKSCIIYVWHFGG